ncbi:hypothetical protein CCHR01_19822 [Colletotrichum chrysophilum]|uniref:Nudix hydrolase domain-containing protein n=1 Tax=Colletotrichum chrysophilum TaxID=1836956 RepID=A0AAD9E7I0_9PEZI|nr:hypothetical protein CCHR01_19822 [Colletotrichum chrysophilum]
MCSQWLNVGSSCTKVGALTDVSTSIEVFANASGLSISPSELLAQRPDIHSIISGAIVFRRRLVGPCHADIEEVLVLKRAASDSFPLKWEIPGGTADSDIDRTIIDVAIRELWEETHLQAQKILCTVGLGHPHNSSTTITPAADGITTMDDTYHFCLLPVNGLVWAIVTFIVEVKDPMASILLRAEEHVDWAWVTESEVKQAKFFGRSNEELEFVTEAMRRIILEGFRLRRESQTKTHGTFHQIPSTP